APVDLLDPADAGAVEPDAFLKQAGGQFLYRDSEVLPDSQQVTEAQIDHLDAGLPAAFDDLLLYAHRLPPAPDVEHLPPPSRKTDATPSTGKASRPSVRVSAVYLVRNVAGIRPAFKGGLCPRGPPPRRSSSDDGQCGWPPGSAGRPPRRSAPGGASAPPLPAPRVCASPGRPLGP